jgi:hypothetical protein
MRNVSTIGMTLTIVLGAMLLGCGGSGEEGEETDVTEEEMLAPEEGIDEAAYPSGPYGISKASE